MTAFKGTERFVVLRYLGSGSFGEVYEVFDRDRQTKVALKMPHQATASGLYYFKREFRALVDVAHPNLATLFELVGDKDQWFFTMELVQGLPFKNFLRQETAIPVEPRSSGATATRMMAGVVEDRSSGSLGGSPTTCTSLMEILDDPLLDADQGEETLPAVFVGPKDYQQVRHLLRELAEGLTALHTIGKVHRDIKPSNVLVSPDGHLTILDFGLVTDIGLTTREETQPSMIIGTPAYMAPEQLNGHPGTEASDWYSVGVMLYEVLTGQQPFRGTLREMLQKKVDQTPIPPSMLVPSTPHDLDILCMRLLLRDPEARPRGTDVLDHLRGYGLLSPHRPDVATAGLSLLIGRDRELDAMFQAFACSQGGTPVLVKLHGGSGTGKTQILRHFVGDLRERTDTLLILHGRCYEQESVPYKAIDPLIDDLSRYLARLPHETAETLVPRHTYALTRVFPVLKRIDAFLAQANLGTDTDDAKAIRRRALLALKELLRNLCALQPVVMIIDDLQWGDLDSAYLIQELMAPPEPPPLLLVLCYRTDEARSAPALAELHTHPLAIQTLELPIKELPLDLARNLALSLMSPDTLHADELASRVAQDSGGNPFFIGELVQRGLSDSSELGEIPKNALYEIIQRRVANLPEDIQRIVETLALAGHPLSWDTVRKSSGAESIKIPPASLLKSERLVRTRSTHGKQALEIYHDFVRLALLQKISGPQRRKGHLKLAEILETSAEAEPETLAKHYILAGESNKAADYFMRAGDHAAKSLAFKGAAELYRKSIDIRPHGDVAIPDLLLKLGDVLSTAGLGNEAAEAYRTLANLLESTDRLRVQRRIAEEYFKSGHFEKGMREIEPILSSVGISLTQNVLQAKISTLWYKLRLKLRSLEFKPRNPIDIPQNELELIDIMWTAVHLT